MVKSKNQNHIIVTLFKKNIQYLVRTEYMHRDDKVKETNQEIDRNLVYRIFCALELAKFDEIVNVDNAEKVANIKIYEAQLPGASTSPTLCQAFLAMIN